MSNIIETEITQTVYKPKCAPCESIVQEKRSWTAQAPDAPRPYCKNPQSPFFMRIPPCRCNYFKEGACLFQETPG
jgi:hypothetical protein